MFLEYFEKITVTFSDWAWGYHLLFLLVGGGIFFMIYSGFAPFLYLKHSFDILTGKFDHDHDSEGDINHFQALSSAIAATVGMGNISGVAVAIALGGPGALFWMWISAIIGMATKFFDCTLSVMYRGKDDFGNTQGGPMYIITEGLGKKWKPMAMLFAFAGLIGMLPMFQANQLTQIIRDVILIPNQLSSLEDHFLSDFLTACTLIVLVSFVIFGGIKRIAMVAEKLVPSMVLMYVGAVLFIIIVNIEKVPSVFMLIFKDAFEANYFKGEVDSIFGGALGAMIVLGVRRAAFSNEAGIGTAPLAHGAAKTNEPVREGLVAMLGPVIDTLLVCTMTALALLITDVWQTEGKNGVSMTLEAFTQAMGVWGGYVLIICAFIFAITTLFTYSYFGTKCMAFLFGAKYQHLYNYFYVSSIILGAVASIKSVMSLIDGFYAMMALPNMIAALLLAPKVKKAANEYFAKLKK